MIQNLIFVILFLKILFRVCNFSPHVQINIIRVFLCQILKQKIAEPIKTSEKYHSFYNRVFLKKTSLILQISTPLKLKIICSQNTAKNFFQFTSFPAKIFLFGGRKKHLHCTISWGPRTIFLEYFKSKYLYISESLLKKMFVTKT